MIYKLSIRNSRLELLRIGSEKQKFKEIKLSVKELPFRFSRQMVEVGDNFENLVELINQMLQSVLPDLTELQISLRENFFQIEKIPLAINKELLEWEAQQYLTDDISSYNYGYYNNDSDQQTCLVILRQTVLDYFDRLVKTLNGTVKHYSVGYELPIPGNQITFVRVGTEFTEFYKLSGAGTWNSNMQPLREESIFTLKFFTKIAVVLLAILTIGGAGYWWYFIHDKNIASLAVVRPIVKQATVDSSNSAAADTAKSQVAKIEATTPKIAEAPNKQEPIANKQVGATNFYAWLTKLIATDLQTIIIYHNNALVTTANTENIKTASSAFNTVVKNTSVVGSSANIVNVTFASFEHYSNDPQNAQKLDQVLSKLGLKIENDYIAVGNNQKLSDLINGMSTQKVGFEKLIISRRNQQNYVAVDLF